MQCQAKMQNGRNFCEEPSASINSEECSRCLRVRVPGMYESIVVP
jgi:predicted amidophosphoribosyltransferase